MKTEKYRCYICGKMGPTEKHHVFGGPNRPLSEKDKLFVYLCHDCHNEPPDGVHFDKNRRRWLQGKAQEEYEQQKIEQGCTPEEARSLFMQRYGRNYKE